MKLSTFVVSLVLVWNIEAGPLPLRNAPHFSHNATLHRRNNINEYGGCDKQYPLGKGKDIVYTAYQDMLKMTQLVHPFLELPPPCSSCTPPEVAPGVLETRYFADLNGQDDRRALIHDVFANAANWYPWFFFDWIGGKRISVYCEVDQPSPKNYKCGNAVGGRAIGGYATNLGGKAKIVFCSGFFNVPNLDTIKQELTQYPSRQSDVQWAKSTGHMFFHEMTHLSIIESRTPHIIVDNPANPVDGTGLLVYGARNTESLAKRFPAYAYVNADNYPFYAAAVWITKTFGKMPDSSLASTAATDAPDYDFPDLVYDDGSTPENTAFDDLDYDAISTDEGIAFAAGDYTPNGWLENRNLRILPLGDSITYGFQSSDGNGYRNDLYNLLVGANNKVNMIGSVQAGTMADNYNEGHSGAIISQIATYTSAYAQRPNVVLLHAGTNDLNLPSDPANAPQRLDALVGQLLAACPDATIVVARIIPSTNAGTSTLIPQFNNAITDLMSTRAQQGQHVIMADMPSGVSTANLADGLHPNDDGYNRMAIKWAIALTAVDSLGWIKDPVAVSGSTHVPCSHDPTWISQDQIANGAGLGANLWLTASCASNPVSGLCDCEPVTTPIAVTQSLLSSTKACDIKTLTYPQTTAIHFADLNGDGRAEYLSVDNSGAVTAFLNLGGPDQGANAARISWLPQGVIATGVGGNRSNVQFADLNGDGRAEYLWIHDDGSVDCWLNLGGPDNGPNAGKVTWLPQGIIATGFGKDGAGVRFADLNGDGRAEYLYVNTDGSVEAYLNLGGPDNGNNAAKVGWLPQGTIATGVGQGRDNVVFADINGDGRADYVTVSRTDGSVMAWINAGGPDNGPNAAKVVWLPHGTIGTGVGTNGKGVQLADLNGDGRAEYLDVAFDTSAVNAWLNGC